MTSVMTCQCNDATRQWKIRRKRRIPSKPCVDLYTFIRIGIFNDQGLTGMQICYLYRVVTALDSSRVPWHRIPITHSCIQLSAEKHRTDSESLSDAHASAGVLDLVTGRWIEPRCHMDSSFEQVRTGKQQQFRGRLTRKKGCSIPPSRFPVRKWGLLLSSLEVA